MIEPDKYRVRIAKYALLFSVLSSVLFGLFLFVPMIVSRILVNFSSYELGVKDYALYATFLVICLSVLFTLVNFFYRLFRHRWHGLLVWEKSVLYVAIIVAWLSLLLSAYC